MITYVPDPYTTDFPRWADEITRQDATFPFNAGEDEWREWASRIVLLADGIETSTLPNPYEVSDWREWGAGLKKVISAG